ncbi:MAG: hypothetical protein IPG67_11090 [Acidobacteria bacterium]|nr:hypothetical protein [Acidobacteriota bacterium]
MRYQILLLIAVSIIIFGAITTANGQACVPIPSGAISWWSAENSSGDNFNRNNAVLQGNAAFTAGKVGQAFNLDGDGDYAQVSTTSALPVGASARTVELWFKAPATPGESGLFQYGTPSGGQMFGLITSSNAPGRLYFYGHSADLAASTVIQPDTWYHGAVTYDGTTVKIYINGQLENSGAIGLNTVIDTTGITIGYRPGGSSWTGQIDEPALYDRALSDSEIAAIYSAGSSGKCTIQCSPLPNGAVGWWPANGNGTDIINSNNGSLVNGVSFAPGKVDQAFSFNQLNQQYVELPFGTTSQHLNNSAGSISAWVNQAPVAVTQFHMVTAFGSGAPGEAVGFGIDNGNVRVYHHTDTFDWQTGVPVTVSTWTHITYTWDGTTERLYKNGSLAASRPRNFNYVSGWARIGFGFINDPSVFFSGQIDEVAIFNRTLIAGEVAAVYNADAAGMCPDCAPPPSNMISMWPGEGNGSDTIGNNNGTLMNGATFAAGKVGQAFNFAVAGQHVEIPDSPSLRPVNGITLDGWFKFNEASPQAALISKPYLTGGFNAYVIWMQGGNLNGSYGGVFLSYPFSPTPGRWYYIAYTYDDASDMHRLFIDGSVVASTTGDGDVAYDSAPLLIGMDRDDGMPVLQLVGMADEVGIAGQAMSPAEALAIYNAGFTGKCSSCASPPANLISWWRGEDNGLDNVGSNHGALLKGTTFGTAMVGRGLVLDGTDDYVRIPASASLNVGAANGLTANAWIRSDNSTGEPLRPILEWSGEPGDANGYGSHFYLSAAAGVLFANLIDTSGTYHVFESGPGVVSADSFYHVALTYDKTTGDAKLYRNGEVVANTNLGIFTPMTAKNLYLGARVTDVYGGPAYRFAGTIDEIQLFARTLSQSEIQTIYRSGGLGTCNAATVQGPGCASIPDGLNTWWRANGNALDQRKANHATLMNGTTFVNGMLGNAFAFDGVNDYVTAPAFNMGSNWSVEGWVNPASCSDDRHCTVFGRSNGTPDGLLLAYLGAGHTEHNEFGLNIGDGSVWQVVLRSGLKYSFGSWYHVAATKSGDSFALYVNGVLRDQKSVTGVSDSYQSRGTRLGLWDYGTAANLQGRIDEVSVYDRALLPSEVWSIFNAASEYGFGKCAGTQTTADLDGDMWSDLSIFRPNGTFGAEWWWLRSTGGNSAVQFGVSSDTVVAADYTGDGKTDVGFWRPSTGQWYILRSEDFSFYAFPFGTTSDIPVPADYDGDGKADPSIFRPSNATWYINRSAGDVGIVQFGSTGDKPIGEDFDGDGKADVAIFRPNGVYGAEWWIAYSSGGVFATQFGRPTDKAVPADYTGDGKADIAFWDPATGYWYILRSDDLSYFAFPFGAAGDLPVPGDYDGDARSDPGVFRPSNGNWYIDRSTSGILIQQFGITGDMPVPNAFVR